MGQKITIMKGQVRRTGQVGSMPRMTTRSVTARSRGLAASSDGSQSPSEAASEASISTIPPPITPQDHRAVADAAARARLDMSRAAGVGLALSQPGPGTDEAAPSTCSLPSVSTPEKTPREYQSAIASECVRANTLVVLPTGAGKTIIAAEVIKRHRPSALFLVPTRNLVDQQAKALRSWTGFEVVRCKGGDDLPHLPFEVVVATPEVFRTAQKEQLPLFQWSSIRVVIFDEVRQISLRAYCFAPGSELTDKTKCLRIFSQANPVACYMPCHVTL